MGCEADGQVGFGEGCGDGHGMIQVGWDFPYSEKKVDASRSAMISRDLAELRTRERSFFGTRSSRNTHARQV